MTLDEITTAIRQLDDAGFDTLSDRMYAMREERRARPAIEQAKQEVESETATKIAQQLAEEHPELVEKPTETADGEVREWEPWHPLKESTHYRYGDKTRHSGKVWRDVLDPTGDKLNVWEPGAQGIDERYWIEESETSETPAEGDARVEEFVQPTSEKPYQVGDKVRFEGAVWESTIANNVWSPSAYPTGWKKL